MRHRRYSWVSSAIVALSATVASAQTPAPAPPAPAPAPAPAAGCATPGACPKSKPRAEVYEMGTVAQSGTFHGDVGSKRSKRFVLPSGSAEVRGELSFLSSDPIVTAEPLRFGDIALFRPSARRAFGDQLELSLGTALLAKQPGGGDEWLFQGGSLGARFEPWAGYAVALDLAAGPQLGGDGSVWSATSSLAAKWSLDREARVLLSLGNSFTALDDDGHLRPRAWLDELLFGTEVQLGDQHGGGWVAVSYGVPLAQAGQVRLAAASTPLDNGVHIDLQVGGVLRVGHHDDWDLFVYHSWIDRGERGHPERLLPVLDGGFDQRQIVLGVSHRFQPRSAPSAD